MARRSGFRADEDFEFVVSEAVMGVTTSRVRAARRRRTTLIDVGNQIIEEAQRLVDQELPGTSTGGRRNPGYDFRRRTNGRTYRSSFDLRVERQGGRLVLIIENTHPHAGDVEFGNDPSGQVKTVRRKRGYYQLPLSRIGYFRYLKGQNSAEARERKNLRSQRSYWNRRAETFEADKNDFIRRLEKRSRFLRQPKERVMGGPDREQLQRLQKRAAEIKAKRAGFTQALGKPRSTSFAKIGEDGKPYLYTKSFRTYRGYAILRRATRSVTVRTLE